MATVNLEAVNVFECECSVEEARKLIGNDDMPEAIDAAFDEAQGHVVQNKDDHAYIVIKVK